jgi:D-amino-acid dehydrogenase
MKISIIGAGLIGITTAYFLKKDGYDVEIIERNSDPGRECSFSNGAQLSYCHAEPWASYSSLLKAIKWIGRSDAPLLFRPLNDPSQWSWLLKFVSQAGNKTNHVNTKKILKLGLYSRKILHEIEDDLNFDFDYKKGGKIFLFKDEACLNSYLKQARKQELLGSEYQILSPKEAIEYEPALANSKNPVQAFVRDPLDESADAYKYCVSMSDKLQKLGVKFHYNSNVKSIRKSGNKIEAIETDKGDFESDLYVLSSGVYSPKMSEELGFKIPIHPIKGYSITVDLDPDEVGPQNSITDYHEKIVYSNLNNKMRVAGTAEFAGYNTDITEKRIQMMRTSTKKIFPKLRNIDTSSSWACLRPSTPDGPPILGKVGTVDNLILNTGHGTLGWTQTFASGKIVSDIISGKKPELKEEWYSIDRY